MEVHRVLNVRGTPSILIATTFDTVDNLAPLDTCFVTFYSIDCVGVNHVVGGS